jgi:hypothetical protein
MSTKLWQLAQDLKRKLSIKMSLQLLVKCKLSARECLRLKNAHKMPVKLTPCLVILIVWAAVVTLFDLFTHLATLVDLLCGNTFSNQVLFSLTLLFQMNH